MKRNKQILMLTVAFVFISFFSAGMLWARPRYCNGRGALP